VSAPRTFIRVTTTRYGQDTHEHYETLADATTALYGEEQGDHAISELRVLYEVFNRTQALAILRAVESTRTAGRRP